MIPAPGLTGSPLDRMEPLRHDPQAFAALKARGDALVLALDDYVPVLDGDLLAWRPAATAPDEELILLGTIDGIPRFAHLIPGANGARRTNDLFALLDRLPAEDAATYAVARSLLDWHARHGFCPRCGSATAPIKAGWARACPNCAAEHFPRTDPVVIMLAEHDGRILVGRQPMFPPRRYSALAGFVEAGESVEMAVARELHEEAGVTATDIRYIASQPWPFPSQLMIACIASVTDDRLTIDTTELEDAFWVTRAQVAAALAGEDESPFLPPPRYAIAHTLFATWLSGS